MSRHTTPIRILCTALCCVIALTVGCAAADEGAVSDPGDPSETLSTTDRMPGYEADKSISVAVGRSTGVSLLGLGVELDPHFLSQNATRPDGPRASDWERVVVPRIRKMQIQRLRVMLLPHWWEPYNDNDDPDVANPEGFTFESQEMKSLYKVLDIAQQTGADVTLVLWGCPTGCEQIDIGHIGRHFLCMPGAANWVVEPESPAEFAESFSTVVKHLIEAKGYTCIRELTPFNEPDGNVCQLDRYIPLVKVLDARLRADGIRDRIRLNLSDNTDTRRFFLEGCARDLVNEADLYNSHTYIFGYETPNSTVLEWERANVAAAAKAGKNHFVGEFGSNQCVGATRQRDIDRYERGVLMTRHVINFLNAGAVGVSYWSLIDQYYGRFEGYQAMQQLGLWRYLRSAYNQDPDPEVYESITRNYQVRPQYYAYSLLTRFIRKGSEVFPLDLENEFAAGSAICSEAGEWCYVFANGSEEELCFDLENKRRGGAGACKVYRYVRDRLPEDDALIEAAYLLEQQDDSFRIAIPPQSVVLLTQQ